MESRGVRVKREPQIPTPEGLRKPDLLLAANGRSFIVDVQVCDANTMDLTDTHNNKIRKYNKPAVKDFTRAWSETQDEPEVSTVTVLWRGIVAPETLDLLKRLGVPAHWTNILVARALGGSISVYANYMGTSGGGDVT